MLNQDKLFEPKVRDKAIETTCQNLIMAGGVLLPTEVADFMRELTNYTDTQLAIALLESRNLVEEYLANRWSRN